MAAMQVKSNEETDKQLQIAYYKAIICNPSVMCIHARYYLQEWLFPTRYKSNGYNLRLLEPTLLQHFFHGSTQYSSCEQYSMRALAISEINLSCKLDVQQELLQWLLTKDCSN